MEKAAANALPPLRFLAVLAVIAWTFFLYFHFSMLSGTTVEVSHGGEDDGSADDDPCRGRYIYVHDLPPRFNADIIRDCRKINDHWGGMCEFVSNAGLGRPLADRTEGVLTEQAGWYNTHQFALDYIFHNRMKRYECLTNHSAVAAAVFVPFYAGFDFVRYHWGYDNHTRDAASVDLVEWLTARPEWRRMGGRDHFLVAGRTGWDFRRSNNLNPEWGTDLLAMPGGRNMTVLVMESTLLHGGDYPVPYPTYFHPKTDARRAAVAGPAVRGTKPDVAHGLHRRAAPPDVPMNIRVRDHVIAQCKASAACTLLGCPRNLGSTQCHTPLNIMRLFQKTVFCLQPPGDSCTRRSVFDSMVAGCIPDGDVRQHNVSIEDVLRAIPQATVERMREQVIRLIPRLLYADPRAAKLETLKDAFDVAVEGILGRVARIRNGEEVNSGGPVDEDLPYLFASTDSKFRPRQWKQRVAATPPVVRKKKKIAVQT
ncbi:hypothetical protein PR202_ga27082 [Eleusine coracana subsp. coracana]|uniref:Exostosin GT47 domain-containing protein n=1 Tax=Eleusine coracana subsp. coracana TaxID=191504 RepID=A0AAV5DF26_ELECO|nr:hypothetical protein PR202_ga27082 [Eleusine coracana subsp. coracana]